jgi:hypothetical protein
MLKTSAPKAPSVRMREASLEDYEQVSELTFRHGMRRRTREEWGHIWLNNPEYRRQRRWPLGWVLEDGGGMIVGTLGNVPLAYEFEGKRLLGAAGRSWVVEEQYRGYATVLMEQYFAQKNVNLFINNTINRHAEAAFAAFGSVRVPVGAWNRSAFWITHYPGFAASALRSRRPQYSKLLSLPLAAALWSVDTFKGRVSLQGREIKREVGFDERFDAFWEDLRGRKPQVLLGVRTRETLAWHFKYQLEGEQLYILTVSEDARILAYMIFERSDKPEIGLKWVRLVDFQSLDDDRSVFTPMLGWMIRTGRQEGVHAVEDVGLCVDCASSPYKRDLPSWLFCYKAAPATLAGKLAVKAAWWPTLFDGDGSL